MGSYASGRLTSRRRKVEDCLQLPIHELTKAGAVKYGRRRSGECYAARVQHLPALLTAFVFDARPAQSTYRLTYCPPASGNIVTVEGDLCWTAVGSGKRA